MNKMKFILGDELSSDSVNSKALSMIWKHYTTGEKDSEGWLVLDMVTLIEEIIELRDLCYDSTDKFSGSPNVHVAKFDARLTAFTAGMNVLIPRYINDSSVRRVIYDIVDYYLTCEIRELYYDPHITPVTKSFVAGMIDYRAKQLLKECD